MSADGAVEQSFGPGARTPTEKALRDIAAAQREALSLYEISQTLGSTLKLSEILPIVAAKLENIANFTTLVIYLAEGNRMHAAYVTGKNAEALKGLEIAVGEGGAGLGSRASPGTDRREPAGRPSATAGHGRRGVSFDRDIPARARR